MKRSQDHGVPRSFRSDQPAAVYWTRVFGVGPDILTHRFQALIARLDVLDNVLAGILDRAEALVTGQIDGVVCLALSGRRWDNLPNIAEPQRAAEYLTMT